MNGKGICPICDNITKKYELVNFETNIQINCPRCGEYLIAKEVTVNLKFKDDAILKAKTSYWIRNHQIEKLDVLTTHKINNAIQNVALPKLKEQIDSLLLNLGDNAIKPSEKIEAEIAPLTSMIGAVDEKDVRYHLYHLWKNDLLSSEGSLSDTIKYERIKVQLTHKGWDKYYELQKQNKDSRITFMAMGYGNKQLDDLFNNTLKKAVDETGFKLNRLDENPKAGIIDNIMRVEIRKSKFLIADLSVDNKGAYWEAGFAEGLGKEVIYICEKSVFDKRHFDTNHCQTVHFEWEDIPSFVKRLKAAIRATFPAEAKMED